MFTSEEMNLMCLYNSGTRLVLDKLRRMNDQEFSALDLYPDFID